MSEDPSNTIAGGIDLFGPTRLKGWAVVVDAPTEQLTIEIVRDNVVLGQVTTSHERPDLMPWLPPQAKPGFDAPLSLPPIDQPERVEFRVKGHGVSIDLPSAWSPVHTQIDTLSENLLTGWAWDTFTPDRHVRLRIFHGSTELGYVVANEPRDDLIAAGIGRGDHAFIFRPESKIDLASSTLSLVPVTEMPLPLLPSPPYEQPEHATVISKVDGLELSDTSVAHDKLPKTGLNTQQVATSWKEKALRYFDSEWYSQKHKLINDRTTSFAHWWNHGRHHGLDPHPIFDTAFYKEQLRKTVPQKDLFLHFLENGGRENTDPHPCFRMDWYRTTFNIAGDLHPWKDYIARYNDVDRAPNCFFSSPLVNQLAGNERQENETLLAYYLRKLEKLQFSPHPLLDIPFVLKQGSDVAETAAYSTFWKLCHSKEIRTHVHFDPRYYRAQGAPIAAGWLAFEHYSLSGEKEGLKPVPLFHPNWYQRQHLNATPNQTLLEHFVLEGERIGYHPCPGFDPIYYLEKNPDVTRAGAPPLRHFQSAGQRELRQCHPLFDIKWYARTLNDGDRTRPLEHWLEIGSKRQLAPHPAFEVSARGVSADDLQMLLYPRTSGFTHIPGISTPLMGLDTSSERLTPRASAASELVHAYVQRTANISTLEAKKLRLDENLARQYKTTNYDRQSLFIHNILREFAATDHPLPLVSVIMPTRNRSSVLQRAINSVLRQTYPRLELIVVDDGSTDGTEALLKLHVADKRVIYKKQNALGVSAARNLGLKMASGEYIAYLDSDNYWEPLHLEVVIKSLILKGVSAGYSMLRSFDVTGAVKYRGAPYDKSAMARENYIDMNVFVHASELTATNIRFDTQLRRCVDWDFILRLSRDHDPMFVPIVGCNYVDDAGTLGRITTDELPGDFYKVCLREIDLSQQITGMMPYQGCDLTVIVPISRGDWRYIEYDIWEIVKYAQHNDAEVIIINNACDDAVTIALAAISTMVPRCRVVHLWRSFQVFPATNLAAKIACGSQLLLWLPYWGFEPTAIDALRQLHREQNSAITAPIGTDKSDVIVSKFVTCTMASYIFEPILTGTYRPQLIAPLENALPKESVAIISKNLFDEIGGFDTDFSMQYGLVDLALKMKYNLLSKVVVTTDVSFSSVKQEDTADDARSTTSELEEIKRRWLDSGRLTEICDGEYQPQISRNPSFINHNWTLVPAATGGRINFKFQASGKPLKIVIRCPAPGTADKVAWGDFHYASAMVETMTTAGHDVAISFREHWGQEHAPVDIAIHIRGIVDIEPIPSAYNVMWIISHPDRVSDTELAAMDLILSAGDALRQALLVRGFRSELLLQGCDQRRFSPAFTTIPGLNETALFVGNSRYQIRPIVFDALKAGIKFQIYGANWETLVPSRAVAGTHIANEDLGAWYGSAAVVLNDHWASMRHFGIISNRIFDVVATGTPVITDAIDGLDAIFGDAVSVYTGPDDLPQLLENYRTRKFYEMSEHIRSGHSLAIRSREILKMLGLRAV